MSSKSLSFAELTSALTLTNERRHRVQEQIQTSATSMHGIIESDAFSGGVKDAINLGIANKHIPIHKGLEESLRVFERELRRMFRNAQEHMNETDDNAIILEFAVAEIKREVEKYHEFKFSFDDDFELIYKSVSDYLDISMPSSSSYDIRHDRLYTVLDTTLENFHTFTFEWVELTELKDKVDREIAKFENVVNRPFYDNVRMEAKSRTVLRDAMVDRMEAREQEILDKAAELFVQWLEMTPREAFLSMSSPPSDEELMAWYMFIATFYDSWTPEQRRSIGGGQINRGAWGIVFGIGAIIMTKGAAKPFVYAAWVGGSVSIAFGTSNIIEGAHNILLSWQWDMETQSFNPIRDTVFIGNQEAYNRTNFWFDIFSATIMFTGHTFPRHHTPSPIKPPPPPNSGRPFDPNGPLGRRTNVDPNTLRTGQQTSLDPTRMQTQRNLIENGIERSVLIRVHQNGVIENGHHGVRAAIEAGVPVTIRVIPGNPPPGSKPVWDLEIRPE